MSERSKGVKRAYDPGLTFQVSSCGPATERFDWPVPDSVCQLSNQQIDGIRRSLNLVVKGEDVPRPIFNFQDCGFLQKLQENLETAGFEVPTAIQMQAIPAALHGRDVLACAETRSGKTAAFLLPVIARSCRLQGYVDRKLPLAIVLSPTRELCAQIEDQAKILARGLPFKTALVVGGNPLPPQAYRISQGVQLIVATPGRLIDLLTKHDVSLAEVRTLVLDEVDSMLQFGFHDQVMQIVLALDQPQMLLFSATIPPSTEKLAAKILKRPVTITVEQPSLANTRVQQTVIWVEEKDKKQKLFDIIADPRHFRPPTLVFVSSKMGADLLKQAITKIAKVRAESVHGDKPMPERRAALKSLLTGEAQVVVCTGVLGRGLDLLPVSQVIIFDMPQSTEEYVHQIGRSKRYGGRQPGSAIALVNNGDHKLFPSIVPLLREGRVPIPPQLQNSPFLSPYAAAAASKRRKTLA